MIRIRSVIVDRAALVATVILLAQTVIYYSGSAKETIPSIAPWSQFPNQVNGWTGGGDLAIDREVLEGLKPDDFLARNYTLSNPHEVASLFIGYFNSRRNGRAPHSPQWCLPGSGWKSVSARVISIPIPGEKQPLPANEYLIEQGMKRELVIYWYHQGARTVANEVVAQLYSLPDLVFHGRTDTALIRIIVPVTTGETDAAKAAAVNFAQGVYPLVRQHIS